MWISTAEGWCVFSRWDLHPSCQEDGEGRFSWNYDGCGPCSQQESHGALPAGEWRGKGPLCKTLELIFVALDIWFLNLLHESLHWIIITEERNCMSSTSKGVCVYYFKKNNKILAVENGQVHVWLVQLSTRNSYLEDGAFSITRQRWRFPWQTAAQSSLSSWTGCASSGERRRMRVALDSSTLQSAGWDGGQAVRQAQAPPTFSTD